jgi:hypothetical protein
VDLLFAEICQRRGEPAEVTVIDNAIAPNCYPFTDFCEKTVTEIIHSGTVQKLQPDRYALGWSQSVLAAKLQIAGFDISRSGVSKIEARLSYVDDKTLLYLAEVLRVQLQELFPTRPPGNRIYDFIEKLETTRF